MTTPLRSESIFKKRVRKFRRLKRGYYSFVLLVTAYVISLALPLLVNNKALVVRYNGQTYFPILNFYPASEFGVNAIGEPNYRQLRRRVQASGRWQLASDAPVSVQPDRVPARAAWVPAASAAEAAHLRHRRSRARRVRQARIRFQRVSYVRGAGAPDFRVIRRRLLERCSATSAASSTFWASD